MTSGREATRGRAAAAACVAAAAGLALSVLPHLLWWHGTGRPVWVADHDDLYYLAVGGHAYLDHPWSVSDPVPTGGGFLPHRPLVFLPGVLAARLLGWGPLGVNLAWRVGAGVGVGLGWYWAARARLPGPWLACGLAVLLMADTGLIECRPGLSQVRHAARILTGHTGDLFASKPLLHGAWRVITPAATMAYLLLFVGLLLRARDEPTPPRLAAAGLGFGLLFHVYFYYWTAAGLALVLAFALDAGRRRVYFHTAWIGGLCGLPAVVGDVLARRSTLSDWLHRTDKFLPIGRFEELLLPKLTLVVLALGLVWVLRSRRDLIPVWALAAAGLGLTNHQVVTGLQIENFHWKAYVGDPVLELLLALLAAGWLVPRLSRFRPSAWAFGVVVAVYFASGLWLRGVEACRTAEPQELLGAYRAYRAEVPAGAPALEAHAVTAGDPLFVSFATVLEGQHPLSGVPATLSPAVSDADWDERAVLNDYLYHGDGPDGYEARLSEEARRLVWGPWGRDPSARARWASGRRALRGAVAADPEAALRRHPVRYLAVPAGRTPPERERLGWELYRRGGRWDVWERRPAPPSAHVSGSGERRG